MKRTKSATVAASVAEDVVFISVGAPDRIALAYVGRNPRTGSLAVYPTAPDGRYMSITAPADLWSALTPDQRDMLADHVEASRFSAAAAMVKPLAVRCAFDVAGLAETLKSIGHSADTANELTDTARNAGKKHLLIVKALVLAAKAL